MPQALCAGCHGYCHAKRDNVCALRELTLQGERQTEDEHKQASKYTQIIFGGCMHCEKNHKGNGRGVQGRYWRQRPGEAPPQSGFAHKDAEGRDDKEVPCFMALIFLNKSWVK